MIEYLEIIGLIAGICSTFSTLPQIIKIWNRRSAKDVSLSISMFILSWIGTILWGIYGLLAHSLSLVIANIISFLLVSSIIVMKIKFKADDIR